ncbi:hypothetical protein O0I10_010009 [Lichtheimia ornata]|uniref:Uncharacterized protein n=1 Tax=Lichtheimia ornata TaxID=688661 RepID=A0AAD7UWD7_9FUNG|nr:uncharacterized protein O0I10_010009 [Lichtheimia ornata]KAJ8654313.1 hypothetical protein O0I10_010009 [Lichtheimia ornata]
MARFFTLFSIAVIALAGFAQATEAENDDVGAPEEAGTGTQIYNGPTKRDPGAAPEGEGEEGAAGEHPAEPAGGEDGGEGEEELKKRGDDGEICDDVV